MTLATTLQLNFTGGEVSPKLDGRVDLDKYKTSVKTMENFMVQTHGNAERRPGTHYVAEVKDSSKATRLVAFEFSVTQAYIIEFGDLYMRFYRNNGQILSASVPYEVTTTYAAADLFELQFAQSADTLYIAHPDYPPRKVTRTGHTSWTIADISFTNKPTGFVGGAGEYPRTVCLYEERLVWAGSDNNPQTVWFSKTADFENMDQGTAQTAEGLEYSIAADQVNVIRWLSPGETLIIGTVGGEWEAHGSTRAAAITPTSINIRRKTTYGSMLAQPVRMGRAVIFAQRSKRKIREFAIVPDTSDSYAAGDLTLLAEHITKGSIVELATAQQPTPTVWAVRADGQLLGMTYEPSNQVAGWYRVKPGGTNAKFTSVAVIPNSTEDYDEVWVVAERLINGNTVKYVEYFEQPHEEGDTQADAFYVDSGLTYDGVSTSTITGLDHLEGQTVHILGDGAVQPTKTVSSGQITLTTAVEKAQVGLQYISDLKTLRLDASSVGGPYTQGRTARVVRAIVRFFHTLGAKVGPDATKLETVVFREGSTPMDSPPEIFSGDKEVFIPDDHSRAPTIFVRQDQPLPCSVQMILPDVGYGET